MAPTVRYIITASIPYFLPRQNPLKATAKVWSVSGIPAGVGIVNIDKTAIIAANKAARI